MFFNSIKEINRLRKEINRLWCKGMSSIYLKVIIETFSKLRFSEFKKFVTRSIYEELQLTQILLNFKTFCYNLKTRGLGAKLRVAFLLLSFERNYDVLKSKSPCILLNKDITLIKTKQSRKWKIQHTVLERRTLCFSSYKLNRVESREKKKKWIFSRFVFYLNV